jgi:hypothetical protein
MEQESTLTICAKTGAVLTETLEGVTMPTDYSFAAVNDYVHGVDRYFEELQWLALGMATEIDKLRQRIAEAPRAIMDTRDILGICAPTEEDFPALYAIQGRRVRLVLDDETPNAALTRRP